MRSEHHDVAGAVLARYQQAMLDFDADALADLYAEDAVHEFPFLTPGHAARYAGREEVRAAYRRIWGARQVELLDIDNTAVHSTEEPGVVISEWTARGTRGDEQGEITLAGVLVITVEDGLIRHVRDYMDVLGLAHASGRLGALAAALETPA